MKFTIKVPSLSRTDMPKFPGAGGRLRGLMRSLRRYTLWGLIGTVMFVAFAWLSIPTRALGWRLSQECKKRGYIVEVEDIWVSPFGGVSIGELQWTFAPSRPGQIPSTFIAEDVDVDVSLWALAFGEVDVDIEGIIGDGRFEANYSKGEEQASFSMAIEDLPLYEIPKARQSFNVPMEGTFAMNVDLTFPEQKFGKAEGEISLSCTACKIGDGVEALYIPGSKSLKKGVTIPQIDIGNLGGKMVVTGGTAETDGTIESNSDDIKVALGGTVKLKDPIKRSRFDLTLKVMFTEALQARSEALRLMVQTATPKTKLEPPEEGLGYRLTGSVGRPRFIGIKSKTKEERLRDRRERQRKRDQRRAKSKAKRDAAKKKREDDKNKKKPDTEPEEPKEEPKEDDERPTINKPLNIEPLEPASGGEPPAATDSPSTAVVPSDFAAEGGGEGGEGGQPAEPEQPASDEDPSSQQDPSSEPAEPEGPQ